MLKRLSGLLLASTKDQAAFQAFGIALILVVWINYFSRIVLYAAAWAHTSAAARALRVPDPPAPAQGPQTPALRLPGSGTAQPRATWLTPFTAGSVVALGLAVLVRKRKEDA